MRDVGAFSLLVTEDCNLGCKYCFECNGTGHKKKTMSLETAHRVVEFMFESAKNLQGIRVTFFGGEPTLAPEVIDAICTRSKELSKVYQKSFECDIVTNATVMNERLYAVIKKHSDVWTGTQLSVDGPKHIQDEYRVFKNGKGTFDVVEKNFPIWKELCGSKLSIHGVLNKNTIPHLFDSFVYFRETWGEPTLWFLPANDPEYTKDDVAAYDREMGKIADYILSKVRESGCTDEATFYAPLNRCFSMGSSHHKPCAAGDGYCCITASGELWPCHQFYYSDKNKETCLGNIWDGFSESKKRVWEDYGPEDMDGCQECEHTECYRCIAENYDEFGNPFVQIKGLRCGLMKVDLKYQRKIKAELENMGLFNGKNASEWNSACDVVYSDCVGKTGNCDIVVPSEKPTPGPEHEPESSTLKAVLDDVIRVLVKHHNAL